MTLEQSLRMEAETCALVADSQIRDAPLRECLGSLGRKMAAAADSIAALETKCRELEAENARLNMEMVAYREKMTPKDVEAMTAVIAALTAEKAARSTKETKVDDGPKFGGWNPDL